ncbi:hypothetical protein C162_20251 [Paenibacillus sp. FSL R7-269]|uniref:hypothetical protein n=2 Tax=unclassified Paenibacillus TaxID=185978 RepID=UPI0003E24FFB|nr:hypothetical protein [Paenibacillus sp. FSL R7-269]ETT45702.1 hypothetical protein C162_20251 [Paenibacillus sp. FSL R7-269]
MLTMIRDKNRFTFPITPAEIQITSSNEIDSFTVITGEEKTSKRLTSKLKRVSFSVIFPRRWNDLWEKGKETITYKSPEQAWKLMEEWKAKPVVINFESLFSQTMWFESMEATYKDGQANLHIAFTFVEFDPVKIVSYSNTQQLLKPGVIITKSSKSRPNTTGQTDKKNQNKKSDKQKKAEAKAAADNAKGNFDYLSQKERILDKTSTQK